MFKVRHGFKRIAGRSCVCATETNHHKKPPARIEQHTLGGPDHKKAHDNAASDVDKKRAVRKDRPQYFGGEAADDVTGVGAENCADGYNHEVSHDGVLLLRSS